jgi:exonuclease SbcC
MFDSTLKTIKVQDFRSISGTIVVPLDAPVVLVHGPNGAGKSSLVAAIALALGGPHVGGLAEPRHLIHHGADRAIIELGTSGGSHTVQFERNDQRAAPGLLSAKEAVFFSERCYLEQSTLTRLLELYQEQPDDQDSPLTRFVKELLRLDELEALIAGLHVAGHVQRVRNSLPSFARAEESVKGHEAHVISLTQKTESVAAEVNMLRLQIAPALAALGAEQAADDAEPAGDDELQRWLEKGDESAELVKLQTQLRRVEEVDQRWRQHTAGADPRTTEDATVAEKAARERYERWRTQHGDTLNHLLTELREIFPRLPSIDSTPPSEAFSAALAGLDSEIARLDKVIEDDAATVTRLQAIEKEAQRDRARLETLDRELADQGAATELERLAGALADLAPHVRDECCPVCGRDFAEISDRPLAAHLAEEISRLSVQATRLQSLAKARLETTTDLERTDQESAVLSAQRLSSGHRTDADSRRERLMALRRQLRQHQDGASTGGAVMRDLVEAQSILSRAQSRDRVDGNLREEIEQVAVESFPDADLAASPSVLLSDARASLLTAAKLAEEHRDQRALTADRRRMLVSRTAEHADLTLELAHLVAQLSEIQEGVRRSHERMMKARQLLREVESTRRSIVGSVFNSALNGVWADLFVRLTPDEPYVPAFCEPKDAAKVTAKLETRRRDGTRGGSPRAMLSAGNLNTAALTLFLALHLSVAPQVPWLLLDDPVQSMDEVHVAQFAALLRTLVQRQGRRLVIAVHERALFDYLALELSPATRDSGLVTVELRRRRDDSSEAATEFRGFVADTALDAA